MTNWIATTVVIALGTVTQTPASSERTVLFTTDRAAALATQCSRRVPAPIRGTWLPDTAAIARIDVALRPAFETALQKSGANPANQHPFNEYLRQYGGLIVGDRRIVYVNAFHETYVKWGERIRPPRPAIEWREVPVNVCDGWTLFFGAEYDTVSGTVEGVTFNGRAGLPNTQMEPTRR